MVKTAQKGFIRAIQGKVIIALFLACAALLLAWGVSKVAFTEMLNTVENISAPNERLRIVSVLSRKISGMDQLQKRQAFNDPGNYSKVFKESKQLRLVLDTLSSLYKDDTVQLERIASIDELLTVRDQQFINYLKVREKLVNNHSISDRVQELNDLANRDSSQSDSTVVTSIKKTSTTTIVPPKEQARPRGFFNKLFGKKREEPSPDQSYKIIDEENIKRDTIALSSEGEIVKGLEESLKTIEEEQKIKSARFFNREVILADANGLLISQMLSILRKVESEAVAQIEMNSIQAKKVVNTGINRISIIMLVFFLLTILLLYLILTDITKSNQYRKELEEARDEAEYHGKAKQRFLSNMSHEIRTPLQSIIGYAELVRQQESPQHKDIEAIHQSAGHLLQIVNEVLDYNRIISGKFTFSSKAFSMVRLLEEVVEIMRPQAEKKALNMVADFQLEGIDQVEGDPFRLKQILFNLLGNAIKFTLEGEVVLSAFYKRQGEYLHFTFRVKDTGIGFTEEEGQHIFNEFEQIDIPEKGTMNQAGAGLGLTIVKSLVEHQGGRIYGKSEEGKGSAFTVYLRFTNVTDAMIEPEILHHSLTFAKTKVWIVDDDQLILDLCSLIFKKNGISSVCFHKPSELLDREWDPAVKFVLMDIRMPEMSGIELCRLLRPKISEEVKIYAITAQVLPEERALLLNQGFNGLIMKPFREKEILSIFTSEPVILQTAPVEEVLFDPAVIKKMTFGDQEQLDKILNRFALDSTADGAALKRTLTEQGHEKTILLLHRLAGRIAQMGSRKLAAEFRMMEIELHRQTVLTSDQQDEISMLLEKLEALLKVVEDYSIS